MQRREPARPPLPLPAPAAGTPPGGLGRRRAPSSRRAREPSGAALLLTHNQPPGGRARRAASAGAGGDGRGPGAARGLPLGRGPAHRAPPSARRGLRGCEAGARAEGGTGLAWQRSGDLGSMHSTALDRGPCQGANLGRLTTYSSDTQTIPSVSRLELLSDSSRAGFVEASQWQFPVLTVQVMTPLTRPGARISPCYVWLPPKEKHELHQQKRNRNRKESFCKG